MSDAAVGSISHILKTAFKDVYEEEKARKGEKSPEKQSGASVVAEEKVEGEGEDADGEIEEPADSGEGAGEAVDGGEGEEKAEGLEEEDAPEPEAEPFPEKLSILPHLQEELASRQAAIDGQINANQVKATELAEYLTEEKVKAAAAEELEEDMLKKQGVMVGQHIPPLPSKLKVSASKLQSYGDYSNNLIVAKEFVEANKVNNLRRTGNLPISELAEQKIEERARKVAMKPKDIPNYALPNETTATKSKLMKERYAAQEQVRKLEEHEKYAETGGVRPKYEPKYGKLKDQLTGHEKAENVSILKGMTHKMSYLRNPKNVPDTVGRMLTRNDDAYNVHEDFRKTKNGRGGTRAAPGGMTEVNRSVESVPPGTLGGGTGAGGGEYGAAANSVELSAGMGLASTSLHEQSSSLSVPEKAVRGGGGHGGGGGSKARGQKGGKGSKTLNGGNATPSPLFVADPPELLIAKYEVGTPVVLPIAFRNVSAISRSVRILPPATDLFTMAPLKYPPNSLGGLCAPGMSVTTTVTFLPESLGDASDSMAVETEGGNFTVPIVAHRDGPKLSMPPVLSLGQCMVGDAMRVQIECANSGGQGKFRLVTAERFDAGMRQYTQCDPQEYAEMGCVRMAPFTIYPVEFELFKAESVNLILEFVPLALDTFTQKFYILCDSTKVFEYTVVAESKQLDLSVVEINEVAFDATDKDVRREAYFEAANLGIEQSQEVVVANDSGLPVEYEWVWLDRHVHEAEFTHKGVLKIEERERGDYYDPGLGYDYNQAGGNALTPGGDNGNPQGTHMVPMADFEASMHGGNDNGAEGTASQSSFANVGGLAAGGSLAIGLAGPGMDAGSTNGNMDGVSKPPTSNTAHAGTATPGGGAWG